MNELKQNERDIIQLVRERKQTVFEFMQHIPVNRATMNLYLRNLIKQGFLIQSSVQPRGKTNHNIYNLSKELRGIKVVKT